MLCCVALRCVALRYVVLYCVVLCWVCCVVLYCIVLCCAAFLRTQVSVGSEERIEGTGLIPPGKQVDIRVIEETSDVSPRERYTSKAKRKQHGSRVFQVRPLGSVIARPYGAVLLRAGEEGTRQDEGSVVLISISFHLTLKG